MSLILIHVFFNVHRHVCLSPKSSDVRTVMNGKYKKAICEQTEENYEWLPQIYLYHSHFKN